MKSSQHHQIGKPIRCAVVGVGRMGQHHARVYHELKGAELVAVVDADFDRAEEVAEKYGARAYSTIGEALNVGQIEVATIAVPTIHHLSAARPLLKRGIPLLIEKPLAHDIQQAQQLVELAAETETMLQVGHIERYNPTIRALSKFGPISPRFIEVHRVSPMTFRSIDVGVVLDVMIHDLDVLLMLTGAEPEKIEACGVAVLGACEDVCNARLVFPTGCVANVTASRLAFKTERKIRIIAEDAYISIDYARKSGVVVRRTANEERLAEVRAHLEAGHDLSDLDYTDAVNIDTLDIDDRDQLELEISDFLESVRTGNAPAADARAGLAAVRTAQRIVESARSHAASIGAESMSIPK